MKEKIEKLREDIINHSDNPDEVILVAVTKTVESAKVNEAISYGITDIGENKVQEVLRKSPEIGKVNTHLIGHLQRNKVKSIVGKVELIHSVDSVRLANEISKESLKAGIETNVLLQVNVAEEESKFGISVEELPKLISHISTLEGIRVKGLMTIAPYEDNPEKVRPYFRKMKELFDYYKNNKYDNISMKYLSMGMSGDYKVALEEGANIIRVGSYIFGERNY